MKRQLLITMGVAALGIASHATTLMQVKTDDGNINRFDVEHVTEVNFIKEAEQSSASSDETVLALKQALMIGTKVSVTILANEGYLADVATKIDLPEEAVIAFKAYNALQRYTVTQPFLDGIGLGDGLQEILVQLFNAAATEVVPEAVTIFESAITNMAVEDGEHILFDGNGAATNYFKDNAYSELQTAYHEPITNSMNNVQIAGLTATSAWIKFAIANNKLAELITEKNAIIDIMCKLDVLSSDEIAAINKVSKVSLDVSDYVTSKALDGLFFIVSKKEDDIRNNAAERTSDLLKRVFGRLDEN